ncbi:MAG: cytidylate kinase family protein [Candidatus Pacearchaeota archaeon]
MGAKTFPPSSEKKPNFLLKGLRNFYEVIENKEKASFNPKLMNLAEEVSEQGIKEISEGKRKIGEKIYSLITNGQKIDYRISEDHQKDVLIKNKLENILEQNKKITISGEAGAGKGELKGKLGEFFGYETWSMGDIMRKLIPEYGAKDIHHLNEMAKTDPTIDQRVDEEQIKMANKQNLIVEGRLSWYFIPNSLKIYLDADLDTTADRIHEAQRPSEGTQKKAYNQVREETAKRKAGDLRRYRQYYGINPFDQNHYDLIIDTTKKSPEEVFETIIEKINPNYSSLKSHNEGLP